MREHIGRERVVSLGSVITYGPQQVAYQEDVRLPTVGTQRQNDMASVQAMGDMSAADWELCSTLEKRQCGEPAKKAVPTVFSDPIIITESDEEEGVGQAIEMV
ncbi:hypothetical protein NDU88_004602 [Pleurodeles waltl]|uniref:Uncharacterized protein n=1 Tax=Pleurodeles waltl TaxID=8319 RepID=A0AAV7WYA8_PLEWA|nr:hypothetical protein NDU88_004602 [Pleurodeles waltl]